MSSRIVLRKYGFGCSRLWRRMHASCMSALFSRDMHWLHIESPVLFTGWLLREERALYQARVFFSLRCAWVMVLCCHLRSVHSTVIIVLGVKRNESHISKLKYLIVLLVVAGAACEGQIIRSS